MSTDAASIEKLKVLAEQVGHDWKAADGYYDASETEMDRRWSSQIWPFIEDCDFSVCVDLAAGHGRNTRKLLEQAACNRVYVVDINRENTEFCTTRFQNDPRVICVCNNGFTIPEVEPESVTTFYSFDAMVHFDSDVVRSYLAEISRVLRPETGRAFLHHSNLSAYPGQHFHKNPHWRNFMSAELMAHYASKEKLVIVRQKKLDWGSDKFIDCFSLLAIAP